MTQIENQIADFNAIVQALETSLASIGEVTATAPERGPACNQAQAYAYNLTDHISMWRDRVLTDRDIMVANAPQASVNAEPVEQ